MFEYCQVVCIVILIFYLIGLLNYYRDNEEDEPFLHSAHIDANKYMIGVLDRVKTAPNTARGNAYFEKFDKCSPILLNIVCSQRYK